MISSSLKEKLVKIRRHLHAHPEIGYQERETTDFIGKQLDELGITYEKNIAKTGVIAELKKGNSNECIALRADIDALPIPEMTELPFASKNQGVMHACGHDIHTTMLLGAAEVLKNADFDGRIKLIFQPSEEGAYDDTDGKSGGQRVVEAGYLDDVKCAVGLHVHPFLDVGALAYVEGNALACSGNFTIEVNGVSSHAGSGVHLANDAVVVATNLVQSLQSVVSRNVPAQKSGVLSVTSIHGGTAPNIIADKVILTGTIRALDEQIYQLIYERAQQIIKGISEAYNTSINFKIDSFYPILINNSELNTQLTPVAKEVFSYGLIHTEPNLGAEDFAFYSQKVPSVFYFIGAKSPDNGNYFLHHPKLILNEDCIPLGSAFLAKSALGLLK